MGDKINLIDDSNDRKYFTIVPNYILNHSTLYDREVYIQLKRIAGEDGTCYASRSSIAKQCGVSVRRLDKSIKYLIKNGWIEFIGKKTIETDGGEQKVNEYRVVDLWKINTDFYDKGSAHKTIPSDKGGASGAIPSSYKGVHKGGAPGAHKEEPIKKNIKKNALNYFKKMDLEELKTQFSNIDVKEERDKALDWLKSTGKRYKDYAAFFRNWLRRCVAAAPKVERSFHRFIPPKIKKKPSKKTLEEFDKAKSRLLKDKSIDK